MVHTFSHTFKDGSKITIAVDMGPDLPVFRTMTKKVAANCAAEYENWVQEVVCPELVRQARPVQMDHFVQKGIGQL